jgi:hypothetical protein
MLGVQVAYQQGETCTPSVGAVSHFKVTVMYERCQLNEKHTQDITCY